MEAVLGVRQPADQLAAVAREGAINETRNAYAVMPSLRIMTATPVTEFLIETISAGHRFFNRRADS